MIPFDTPLIFSAHVQGTEAGGEIVVLDLQSEKFFGLNEVASRVWQELESGRTLLATLETLQNEFEVAPDLLRADILQLVQTFVEHGWIENSTHTT